MSSKCPVCNTDIPEIQRVSGSFEWCSCQRCGDFQIKVPLSILLPSILENDNKKIAVLSHWIRKSYESIVKEPPDEQYFRKVVTLDKELVDNIIKNPPPNPAEQADNFVRWLGDNIEYADHYIEVNKFSIQAIIGSINEAEFIFIFSHLKNKGIIKVKSADGGGINILALATLSFNGWERYEELKLGEVDSRKAFMAMKYGDEQLYQIVNEIFKAAVEKTGFELFKLVDRPQPAGLIDDRIRVEIQTSRFLIADLTHENRGAYWEAGYAEGLGKPVIYTCKKKKFKRLKTHFDTNHHLTILWDDVEPGKAGEELKATIRATLPSEAKLIDE